MRALILIAWKGWWTTWFQLGTKPKCLHTVDWKVLLEYNIKILNDLWVEDIVLVVWYRWDTIESFIKEKNIHANIVYNHDWRKSAINTLKVWFQWESEDILIIYGDTLLDKSLVKDILDSTSEVTFISSNKQSIENKNVLEIFQANVMDSWIFRINKSMYHIFDDADKVIKETELFLQEFHGFSHADVSWGVTLSIMIKLMMLKSKSIDFVPVNWRYKDIDFFHQTDEYKRNKWKIYFTAFPLYNFLQKTHWIRFLKQLGVLDLISKIKKILKR